jgi:type II secretory pathway pseudopilin PulG
VTKHTHTHAGVSAEHGYTMIELLVSLAVLMIISATVMDGVLRLTRTNQTVANRSEMHAGVRNVTELLQQEIGQAGRITLPAGLTIAAKLDSSNYTTSSTLGMFVGEQIVVGTGPNEETVELTGLDTATNKITATFFNSHDPGAPVSVYGGFKQGVIPPSVADGSTGTVLKIFGDINGTGNMVFIQYECNINEGRLYRRSMAYDVGAMPPLTPDQTLLNNIVANPDGSDCFKYQEESANGENYVVDVAITLTVQTPSRDPVTGLFQTETKALLNVSPRNVFNVWQLANAMIFNRVQKTPPTVTALLPY